MTYDLYGADPAGEVKQNRNGNCKNEGPEIFHKVEGTSEKGEQLIHVQTLCVSS